MTLQWLGQGQVMVFAANHIYRGVWLLPGRPTDIPCPLGQDSLDEVQSILKTLAGGQWDEPVVFQTPNVFDMLRQYGEWPADRRTVASRQSNQCVIFTQMTPITDVQVPLDLLKNALLPGSLVSFWDQTSGQRLVDPPTFGSPPPPTQSPGQPPIINIIPPGGGTVSPGQPPKEEKKMSPFVWVLGGAVLIGAVYLVTQSRG
jgi:hypothetical protein